jgi:hypothetical protein
MPYANPEKARDYQREYQRKKRAGSQGTIALDLPASVRIKTAEDVRVLLETTINEVREADVDVLAKARCIGYLAGITMKAIETANLEGRLTDIEETLKKRGGK